jgi:rhodanese-related sulfurtransferase
MDRGFSKVRPLAGGLDAWFEAGYGGEAEPEAHPDFEGERP